MDQRILTILAGLLAAAFVLFFTLALIRRGRPEGRSLFRSGTAMLGLAGLLMIATGFVARGDMSFISSGFLMLVLATGMELGPNRKKGG